MFEIKIERINANEDELLLTEVLVNEGDYVNIEQEVAIVETTKSSISIFSKYEGFVSKIKFIVGDMVEVGATIIFLTNNNEDDLIKDLNIDKSPQNQIINLNGNAKSRLLNKKNKVISNKEVVVISSTSLFKEESVENINWVIEAKQKIESKKIENIKFTTEDLRRLYPNSTFEDNITIKSTSIFIEDNIVIKKSVNINADKIYIGSGVSIGKGTNITTGELIIQDGSTIAEDVLVDLAGGKTIQSKLFLGPLCLIGSRVMINTSRSVIIEQESALSPGAMIFTHSFWQSRLEGYQNKFAPVYVGPKSWIGAGCQILPGINIGEGSIVVSNSTVIENVEPKTMVAGVPALVIKKNLSSIVDIDQKKSILRKIFNEFLIYLSEKSIDILNTDNLYIIKIKSQEYFIIINDENTLNEVDKSKTILLTFNCQKYQIQNYYAVFDFVNYIFLGNENDLVHTLRNHLRRNGIRFSPYSWRPNYLKEL